MLNILLYTIRVPFSCKIASLLYIYTYLRAENLTELHISQNDHYIAQYLPVYEDNVDYTQNHRNNSNHGALDQNVRKNGLSCGPWVFLANPKHCKVTAGSLRQGPKNREQTLD